MLRYTRFAAIAAAAVAILYFPPPALAADHRDAPTIDDYSAVDINDIFMFRDPQHANMLVMALSVQAIADPKFGSTYHFQPNNAVYRFNFSTTGDGRPTSTIDFTFSDFANGPTCRAPAAACQTFVAKFPHGIVVTGPVTQGTSNATPLPPQITKSAAGGGITVFAGPREDPFFFDLIGFNRFLADLNAQNKSPATPNFGKFTGVDAFLGKNINAIVIEFPINLIAGNATKFQAWASTYLGEFNFPNSSLNTALNSSPGNLRQVDRMGNPAVNTALISAPLKDAFNFGIPQNDARDFAATIVASLKKYGVASDPNSSGVVGALATAALPDTLKFDTSLPDGYLQVPPNGRKPADRTTDFLLTLFLDDVAKPAGTFGPHAACAANHVTPVTAFSDCTAPKEYLSTFPYLGPPLQQTP